MSDAPLLRVVRGTPNDDEVAALVLVLTARAAAATGEVETAPSRWADPASRLRTPLLPGPGRWRWSQR